MLVFLFFAVLLVQLTALENLQHFLEVPVLPHVLIVENTYIYSI